MIYSLYFFSENAKSTNPPARASFQALATLVEDSANRIRIHQALLVLQRTPVSVLPVEVLLEICFIIIAVVAIIVYFCTCKIRLFPLMWPLFLIIYSMIIVRECWMSCLNIVISHFDCISSRFWPSTVNLCYYNILTS